MQQAKDEAKAEYAAAFEAATGKAPTGEETKGVYDAIQTAEDVAGVNDALAAGVEDAIESLAGTDASEELKQIVADYVADVTAAAESATAAGNVADLTDIADKAAAAVAVQKHYEKAAEEAAANGVSEEELTEMTAARDEALAAIDTAQTDELDTIVPDAVLAIDKELAKAEISAAAGSAGNENIAAIVEEYNKADGVIDKQTTSEGAALEAERAKAEIALEQAKEDLKDLLGDGYSEYEDVINGIVEKGNAALKEARDEATVKEALDGALDELYADMTDKVIDRFEELYKDILGKDVADVTASDMDAIHSALDYIEGCAPSVAEDPAMSAHRDDLIDKLQQAAKDELDAFAEELAGGAASGELTAVLGSSQAAIDEIVLGTDYPAIVDVQSAVEDAVEAAKDALTLQQAKDDAKAEFDALYKEVNGSAPAQDAPKGVTRRIHAQFSGIFKDKRKSAGKIFVCRLPSGTIDNGKSVIPALGKLQSVRKAVVHGGDIGKTAARTGHGKRCAGISAEEKQSRIFQARIGSLFFIGVNVIKNLVYAKHTPWCQTVKISEFIIVLPIIFLDGISSIWYYIIVPYGTKYNFRRCRYERNQNRAGTRFYFAKPHDFYLHQKTERENEYGNDRFLDVCFDQSRKSCVFTQ